MANVGHRSSMEILHKFTLVLWSDFKLKSRGMQPKEDSKIADKKTLTKPFSVFATEKQPNSVSFSKTDISFPSLNSSLRF